MTAETLRWMAVAALVALTLMVAPAAEATMLTFVPSDSTIGVGDELRIDIELLGLDPFLSVGAFDLRVSFVDGVLSFVDILFGPYLGVPDVTALTDVLLSPGEVDFAEVSLLPAEVLDVIQPSPLPLATLVFIGIAEGVSPLFFTGEVIVDDVFGEVIPMSIGSGLVTVPHPTPLVSLLAAVAAIGAARRFRFLLRRVRGPGGSASA